MDSKSEAIRALLRDRPGIKPAEAKRMLAERGITISSTLFRLARLRWSKKLEEERRADEVFRQLGDEEWCKEWSWTRFIRPEECKRRSWRRFLRRWRRMTEAEREAEARRAAEVDRSRRDSIERQARLREEQEQRRRESALERERIMTAWSRSVDPAGPAQAPRVAEGCEAGQSGTDARTAQPPMTDAAGTVPTRPTSLSDYLERRRRQVHDLGTTSR